jgi:hypothetical protein
MATLRDYRSANVKRQQRWRAGQREAGRRMFQLWLDADAAAELDRRAVERGGAKADAWREILSDLLTRDVTNNAELEAKLITSQEQGEGWKEQALEQAKQNGRLQNQIEALEAQIKGRGKAKGSPEKPPESHPTRPHVLETAERWRAEGLSLTQIADRLNSEGIRTLSGRGQWTKATVDNLFRRYL